jgi:hypothetical protein
MGVGTKLLASPMTRKEKDRAAQDRRDWLAELDALEKHYRVLYKSGDSFTRGEKEWNAYSRAIVGAGVILLMIPLAKMRIRQARPEFPPDELRKIRRMHETISLTLGRLTLSGLKSAAGSREQWRGQQKEWSRWQAFIENQHIEHPELTYSSLRRLCVQKFQLKPDVVKRRCRNPQNKVG